MRIEVSSLKSLDRQPFEYEIQAAEPGLPPLQLVVRHLSVMEQIEASANASTYEQLWLNPQSHAESAEQQEKLNSLRLDYPDPSLLPDGRRLANLTNRILDWGCTVYTAQIKKEYLLTEILAFMMSDEYGSGFADLIGRITTGNRGAASPLQLPAAS